MKLKLFQNRPNDNQEAFRRELLETNYQRVFYTLRVLMPVSLIMWSVSFAIQDTAVIQRANFFLFASSVVLFVMSLKYPVGRSYEEQGAKMVIVNFTYLALLIWGTTLFGFHEDNTILLLDMILVIIVMAFMLLAEYQVLIGFYAGHIAYLFVATPYLADGFDYPPKVITPILLVSTMLFLSRIIYRQHMERFILGEKLKMKQEDLKAELIALSGKQFSPKVVHAFLELIKEETIYGYDFQSGDEKAF